MCDTLPSGIHSCGFRYVDHQTNGNCPVLASEWKGPVVGSVTLRFDFKDGDPTRMTWNGTVLWESPRPAPVVAPSDTEDGA